MIFAAASLYRSHCLAGVFAAATASVAAAAAVAAAAHERSVREPLPTTDYEYYKKRRRLPTPPSGQDDWR